jgi:hypothetical protein
MLPSLLNHTLRVVKIVGGIKVTRVYVGYFQPTVCLLPIDADVERGDTIELVVGSKVKEKRVVDTVNRFYFVDGIIRGIECTEVTYRS